MYKITNGWLINLLKVLTGLDIVPTGSRVFGDAAPASKAAWDNTEITGHKDFDVLVAKVDGLLVHLGVVTRLIGRYNALENGGSGGSIFLTLCGVKVNFIILDKDDLKAWKHATACCTAMRYSGERTVSRIMLTKVSRVRVFADLCSAFKYGGMK